MGKNTSHSEKCTWIAFFLLFPAHPVNILGRYCFLISVKLFSIDPRSTPADTPRIPLPGRFFNNRHVFFD